MEGITKVQRSELMFPTAHDDLPISWKMLSTKSLTRGAASPFVRRQPIRCLSFTLATARVYALPCNRPVFSRGWGRDCTLHANRQGHNGPSVPVTRTRRSDNPLDKRTYQLDGRTEDRGARGEATRTGNVKAGRRNR